MKSNAGAWSECSKKGTLWQSAMLFMLISRIRLAIVYPSLQKEHALVISTECFLANFPLYKNLFCSVTFPFNSAERTTATSRPLLEAFCKESGKAEIRKCSVKLQELIISEVQILFSSFTHWKEIMRKMTILQSCLSLQGWVQFSDWCQSRQLDWHLHWHYFTSALRQSDSKLWPLIGMEVSVRSLGYG